MTKTKQILNNIKKRRKLLALLMGCASVFALPPFNQFYILFISIGTLFLLIENSEKSSKAFAFGYWFGFGYFALGLSWAANALLIDDTLKWFYPVAVLGFGLFFGLFIAFPAYFASKYRKIYYKLFAFCSLWVIFEWIRSFLFTGFPWNPIGSALTFDIRLLQPASLFGVYGLSFLVLTVTIAPLLAIAEREMRSYIYLIAVALPLTFMTYTYGNQRIQKNTFFKNSQTKIRIVQPAIPQKYKWDRASLETNLQSYIDFSNYPIKGDKAPIDFIIWGETASPFALDHNNEYLERVTDAIPNKDGYLITGSYSYEYDREEGLNRPTNSLFVIDKQGNIIEYYNKTHLVPFGEYIPFKQFLPEWIRPITNVVANFKEGEGHKTIKVGSHPSFAPLICYEIIFPNNVIDRKNKPDWIVNVTNDGWYGDSMGPYQHLASTQLRAIEEGVTIVRAANTGISAIISYTGEVLEKIPLNRAAVMDTYIPQKSSISTTYNKIGNLFIFILIFANIIIIFGRKKQKK